MTATLTHAVLKAKTSKADALKRKLDKRYADMAKLFYVGTEYLPETDEIHVWVNATATDDTVESGAFNADTRAWELYRSAQRVVDGILDTMVEEMIEARQPMPQTFRAITEDEFRRAPRGGYRQAQCTHCAGTGRRQAKGHAEGTTMVCALCCGHGTLWTNNPN